MECKSIEEVAKLAKEDAAWWESNVINKDGKKEPADWEIDDFLGELVNYIYIRNCKGAIKEKWRFYISQICSRFNK